MLQRYTEPLALLGAIFVAGVLAIGLPRPGVAAEALSEAEAHDIAAEAYINFHPMIAMDLTRPRSANVEPGKEFGESPMNIFLSVSAYPPADMKVAVRANLDPLAPSDSFVGLFHA
jgi:hypothetical protein